MASALLAIGGAIIAPVSALTTFLTTTLVHPAYYPYPWATTLHAARISLVYRGRLSALGNADGRLGRGAEFAGFLMMVSLRYSSWPQTT